MRIKNNPGKKYSHVDTGTQEAMQLVQHFYISITHSLQGEVGYNFSGIGQVIGNEKGYKVFLHKFCHNWLHRTGIEEVAFHFSVLQSTLFAWTLEQFRLVRRRLLLRVPQI